MGCENQMLQSKFKQYLIGLKMKETSVDIVHLNRHQ